MSGPIAIRYPMHGRTVEGGGYSEAELASILPEIRKNLDQMPSLLRGRAYDPGALERWGALDAERRSLMTSAEGKRSERNAVSAEVGKKRKAGQNADAEQERSKSLGEEIAALEARLTAIDGHLRTMNGRIGVATAKPGEFIVLRVGQDTSLLQQQLATQAA